MTTVATQASRWQGFDAVRSSLGEMTIDVVPALGAKIASLTWRGEEWLLQPRESVDWSKPRVAYESAELCGWDEMFPTIVGTGLPDHGDVWNREWATTSTPSLDVSVECHTVPVSFRRTICLMAGGRLSLDYDVTNLSDGDVSFLWAAHPQFVVNETDHVSTEGASLVGVTDARRGSLLTGSVRVADIAEPGGTGKWWNRRGDAVRGMSLERGGARVSLSLSAPHPPQWGLWIDRGAIAQTDVVSIQPALGWHDDLHRAVANGTAARLAPHASLSWRVGVEFSAVHA
ncbi:hypothetical protein [Microcella sp.]|uniref:hypothetical protein n=1 Tax=Microcella sp. TaxID=1913979 RepID=UPI003F71D0D6